MSYPEPVNLSHPQVWWSNHPFHHDSSYREQPPNAASIHHPFNQHPSL